MKSPKNKYYAEINFSQPLPGIGGTFSSEKYEGRKQIGFQIKSLRKERNLTQNELSELAGITRANIAYIS